jgi:hypothetical protein
MLKACAELLQLEHRADAHGFIHAEGEKWVGQKKLISLLGLHRLKILPLLSSCRSIRAKDRKGTPATFYSLRDAEVVCGDLLAKKKLAKKKKGKDSSPTP